MQNKIRKNINPENFLRNAKQEFPCQSLESFSGEYYNMENKILDFQFGHVCANQTRSNYSVACDRPWHAVARGNQEEGGLGGR